MARQPVDKSNVAMATRSYPQVVRRAASQLSMGMQLKILLKIKWLIHLQPGFGDTTTISF